MAAVPSSELLQPGQGKGSAPAHVAPCLAQTLLCPDREAECAWGSHLPCLPFVCIRQITSWWWFFRCAGVCSYEGRGGMCSIRLSEPLLKLRPRKDLVEVSTAGEDTNNILD